MPLSQPPRDAAGAVVPHDHDGIAAEHRIIRRISSEHVVDDEKAIGGRRLSSMALQPSSRGNRGMSVDIEQSILDEGLDVAQFVTTPIFTGSVWFRAGDLRAETMKVGYDPLPDNAHHGEVWGEFPKSRRNRLLKMAAWYVQIDGVDLFVG